jgi:hypothetical protein
LIDGFDPVVEDAAEIALLCWGLCKVHLHQDVRFPVVLVQSQLDLVATDLAGFAISAQH